MNNTEAIDAMKALRDLIEQLSDDEVDDAYEIAGEISADGEQFMAAIDAALETMEGS